MPEPDTTTYTAKYNASALRIPDVRATMFQAASKGQRILINNRQSPWVTMERFDPQSTDLPIPEDTAVLMLDRLGSVNERKTITDSIKNNKPVLIRETPFNKGAEKDFQPGERIFVLRPYWS